MIIFILIMLYLAIFFFDFIKVIKTKKPITIMVYGIIFTSTFITMFLCQKDVNIPSPSEPIKYFINNILNLK